MADDYAASTATTGVVGVGGSITGNIESTQDADWFRVTLTAGRSYEFDLQGSDSGQGTLPDPFLRLRDSSGNSISYDFDSGTGHDARITFAPAVSGTYYLAADGSLSSDLGTYKLSATDLGAGGDDYAASTATTGVVSVGGSITGNIESMQDADWFRVTLTAGRSYQFDLQGSDSGQGTLPDPFLRLRDSSGNSISYDFDSGTGHDARITFAPTVSGTYYLAADGALSSGLGTYKLSATDTTASTPTFVQPSFELGAFGPGAGGWSSDDLYKRELADVNGDGRDDIIGFGSSGVYVSLATGNGHFAAPTFELGAFGPGAGGWSSDDLYKRELADVNGDGRDDIVGFGSSGVYVSLATGNGHFAAPTFELGAFGPSAGGWSSDDLYKRELADVNGDQIADIVGFASSGVYESLATGNGHFAAPTFELAAFGPSAGGWSSDDLYKRELADVNGDGKDDIVGFASSGVIVSLATGNGHFAAPTFELADFAPGAGGWSSDDLYKRELADVNGDHMADILGFGSSGVYASLATGNGHFAALTYELAAFAPGAGGWSSDDLYKRELADVNGDHMADIVGFASSGVYGSQSHAFP
jgi:hypothetical protein